MRSETNPIRHGENTTSRLLSLINWETSLGVFVSGWAQKNKRYGTDLLTQIEDITHDLLQITPGKVVLWDVNDFLNTKG